MSLEPGYGHIQIDLHGQEAVFTKMSSTYPLKLLSPRLSHIPAVGLVYMLSYGGGLVSGDRVNLQVRIGAGARGVLLSQGSTKVFKMRPGTRAATLKTSSGHVPHTTQTLTVQIESSGSLFLLPDPVTCFRDASYTQTQTFSLPHDASLVAVDWITCGRQALEEEWVFSRYCSVNEVVIDGKRVVRDVMVLENEPDRPSDKLPKRTLAQKMHPYPCYATVLLFGSQTRQIVATLKEEYSRISILKTNTPETLLWSLSQTENDGAILRVAGKETEQVKRELKRMLSGLESVLGKDAWARVL